MDIKPEYVICLYLAKFSPKSYENLGFSSWTECFNVLADRLNVKPSTLKNHRDTFDAIYPNERKGWHQRELRPMALETFERYDKWSEEALFTEVKKLIGMNDAY